MKYRYTINGELQAIIEAESKQDAYAVAVDYRNKYVRNGGIIKFSGCKLTPLNQPPHPGEGGPQRSDTAAGS